MKSGFQATWRGKVALAHVLNDTTIHWIYPVLRMPVTTRFFDIPKPSFPTGILVGGIDVPLPWWRSWKNTFNGVCQSSCLSKPRPGKHIFPVDIMEGIVSKKLGDVFGGNPLLETNKLTYPLPKGWEFRLTFGVPEIQTGKDTFFCQKIAVGILWANIPEMSSLKNAKRCCVIYFHICQKDKKNNKTPGLWRSPKGRFQTTQIVNFLLLRLTRLRSNWRNIWPHVTWVLA